MLLGGGSMLAGRWIWPLQLGGLIAAAIGWVASLGTRALSRYREFAADAGAVALTGHPAMLASALMKVSDGVHGLPTRDLRVAAARDAFHLLPVAARAAHHRDPPVAEGADRAPGAHGGAPAVGAPGAQRSAALSRSDSSRSQRRAFGSNACASGLASRSRS